MRLKTLDKARIYMCWRIARWAKAISDDGWSVWKAVLAMGVMESFIIIIILINIEMAIGIAFIPAQPEYIGLPIAAVLAIFNYFTLVRRWDVYEEEFLDYTKKQHVIYGFFVAGAFLLTIGALALTMYFVSQNALYH